MERRTEFYSLNVMMPLFLMSILIVLVFIVPVSSGEKLSFVLTVLLSLSVLMTIIAETLPATSITTSVLGLYLGVVLVLAGVAVLFTVLILIMFHTKGGPKQRSISMGIYRCVSNITCSKTSVVSGRATDIIKVAQVDQLNEESVDETDTESVREMIYSDVNWQDMAIMMDKLCFVLFSVVTFVVNISFELALTENMQKPNFI